MYLKYKTEFKMLDGSEAYFTLGKNYKLHTTDNISFFVIDDTENIHFMSWPNPDDDFDTLDYFGKVTDV